MKNKEMVIEGKNKKEHIFINMWMRPVGVRLVRKEFTSNRERCLTAPACLLYAIHNTSTISSCNLKSKIFRTFL